MSRVVASPKQIASVVTVVIRRMPKKMWRDLEKHWELSKEHRQGERPEIERMIGEAVAAHFAETEWEVTFPDRGNLFG